MIQSFEASIDRSSSMPPPSWLNLGFDREGQGALYPNQHQATAVWLMVLHAV